MKKLLSCFLICLNIFWVSIVNANEIFDTLNATKNELLDTLGKVIQIDLGISKTDQADEADAANDANETDEADEADEADKVLPHLLLLLYLRHLR